MFEFTFRGMYSIVFVCWERNFSGNSGVWRLLHLQRAMLVTSKKIKPIRQNVVIEYLACRLTD